MVSGNPNFRCRIKSCSGFAACSYRKLSFPISSFVRSIIFSAVCSFIFYHPATVYHIFRLKLMTLLSASRPVYPRGFTFRFAGIRRIIKAPNGKVNTAQREHFQNLHCGTCIALFLPVLNALGQIFYALHNQDSRTAFVFRFLNIDF